MKIPMPAAVLAGGTSRRMGRAKAGLPYGAGTLLEHQTSRLVPLFEEVLVVVKHPPVFAVGPARVLFDVEPGHSPIYGLIRALAETDDRVFALAVDLPVLSVDVIRAIAHRGLATSSSVVLPEADGFLQPLAAVWRRSVLPTAAQRIARGELSLHGLAQEAGAEIFPEAEWRRLDPSGNSFANLNTLEQYTAMREKA